MPINNTHTDIESPMPSVSWNEVIIGGTSGIVFNGVIPVSEESAQLIADILPPPSQYDPLPFDVAFATTRDQLGPGKSFTWQGMVYSTYNSSEWNDLSPESQQNLAEQALRYDIVHVTTPGVEPQAIDSQLPASGHIPASESNPPVQPQSSDSSAPQPTHQSPTGHENDDIVILGFRQEVNRDGTVTNYGLASVNNQQRLYVDSDGSDVTFDYMMVDFNGDNIISENEIIDISNLNISVSRFRQQAELAGLPVNIDEPAVSPAHDTADHTNPFEQYIEETEHLPDYMNDADPGDLL